MSTSMPRTTMSGADHLPHNHGHRTKQEGHTCQLSVLYTEMAVPKLPKLFVDISSENKTTFVPHATKHNLEK